MVKIQKVALVTGANRGIGLATTKLLLDQGYFVYLTVRTKEKGEKAIEKLQSHQAAMLIVDVTDLDSIKAAVEKIISEKQRIDVLVNNAGTYLDDAITLKDGDIRSFEKTFQTNTLGALYFSQLVLPSMEKNGYGRIVNISSGYGAMESMKTGVAAYKISKLALNGITRILADEVQENIKINAVCPGWVRTEMGGPIAPRTPDQAAKWIVWAATLDIGGPNGDFFRDGKKIDW